MATFVWVFRRRGPSQQCRSFPSPSSTIRRSKPGARVLTRPQAISYPWDLWNHLISDFTDHPNPAGLVVKSIGQLTEMAGYRWGFVTQLVSVFRDSKIPCVAPV